MIDRVLLWRVSWFDELAHLVNSRNRMAGRQRDKLLPPVEKERSGSRINSPARFGGKLPDR